MTGPAADPGDGTGPEPTGFSMGVPTLSRGGIDRSGPLRAPDRLPASWASASVLVLDPHRKVRVDESPAGPALVLIPAADLGPVPPPGAVLIGRAPVRRAGDAGLRAGVDTNGSDGAGSDGGEADVWAVPRSDPHAEDGSAPADLRTLGAQLGDVDAALLTTAVALLSWHRSAGFCPVCGRANEMRAAGWSRRCPADHEQFPRTDPAVIVLVHDGAGSMVLARQPVWAPGRMSVLAGFCEAGESLEATVVREIGEEVGLTVTDPVYLGSQPWPFPRSLMVGFAARAPRGAEFVLQDGEIEQARWVTRAQVRRLLADEQEAGGESWLVLPGPVSIARRMIEGWAAVGG